MKKILALITALVLVMSFASCMPKADEELIIGTWETEFDMTEAFNESMGAEEEMAEYISISDFKFTVRMTFKDDGTYALTVDEESATKAINKMKNSLVDGLTKYFEDTAEEAGMTMDDFLSLMGMSVEDFVDAMLGDDVVEEMVDEMNTEGKYELKDGKLYTTDDVDDDIDESEYETYEISNREFKLLEAVGADDEDEAAMEKLYPIVFERIE